MFQIVIISLLIAWLFGVEAWTLLKLLLAFIVAMGVIWSVWILFWYVILSDVSTLLT